MCCIKRSNSARWLTILFFYLLLLPLQAQLLNFRNYNAGDGLVQSQVYAIVQDNDGYLWFATVNGISIFDGYEFKTITRKDGLAENRIYSALKDYKGNLWFGHKDGGVTRYDWEEKEFKIIRLPLKEKKGFGVSFFEDHSHKIWAATGTDEVFYFEDDSLVHFPVKPQWKHHKIISVAEDDRHRIWLGSDSLVYVYNFVNDSLINIGLDNEGKALKFSSMANDGKGSMWLGTHFSGLFRYNQKTRDVQHFTKKNGLAGDEVTSLFIDPKGKLWVSNQLSGVSYTDLSNIKKIKFTAIGRKNGLPYNGINVTFLDREGNYWFGTNGRGTAELRDRRFELWKPGNDETGKSQWSFFIDSKGIKWFGTESGIWAFKKDGSLWQKRTRYKNEPLGRIYQIAEDRFGIIWFVTSSGICYRFNKKTNKLNPFRVDKNIFTLVDDKNGNIVLGGKNTKIMLYNVQTKQLIRDLPGDSALVSRDISVLYKDSAGTVWVGLFKNGLYKWDGNRILKVSSQPEATLSIAEGPEHDLWILNDSDGLFRYFDGQVTKFDLAAHGLQGLALFSVLADSKSVWLGTTTGLARWVYGDDQFILYTKKAGYPVAESNQNAVFKDKQGNLWFGTIEGAICYHPDREEFNPVPPQVHVKSIKLFLKEIPLKSPAQFKPSNNYLSFGYVGISFTAPEGVRYRYRLVGLDKDWLPETAQTSVTYSSLPPGQYTFQVIARNADGVWNTQPAEYSFEILTPFWQTWWFVLLVLVILTLTIYGYIYSRTTTMKRINRILEDKVQTRTHELQQEKDALEKALTALQESESKFKTYTELTSSAIYIHQKDRFRFVNKAGEKISGYSKAELMQMNIWDLVHSDYKQMMQERLQARIKGEKTPARYEFKILTKDGQERWLDFTGQIINYEDEPALLATVFDITERKKAEEALLAEKERLMVTLRSIGDGVITTDTKGRISLMNDRAKEILDCSEECKIGNNINKVLYIFEEQTGIKKNNILNPIFQGVVSTVDESNLILNSMRNRQKFVSLAVSSLKDSNNKLLGAVLVIRDDTEKRQMQQELVKGQKLESVGVLAGGIAHDFNNILTAIIGNLSLAKLQLNPDHPSYNRIENAEKASARAQDLTQQLLTFSKGGAPVKQIASIEEIIRDSVAFILSGSNVKANLSFSKHIPTVEVDAGQISQVVQNLIINADQAMPDGGSIEIDVQLEKISTKNSLPIQPGNYVVIKVQDQGIGIAKEYLDKIFDPFFTTKQSGSGLGLATSYSILQKHGGLITVDSTLGKGTIFKIYLPASKGTFVSEKSEQMDLGALKGKGRILIMDDEVLIHETISGMLSQAGYEIEISKDGYEMLEKYKQAMEKGEPFDVVFMDLTIPGSMGGKEAIKELLKIDAYATAVVSSGYSSDPVMAEYQEFGFKACLRKPYRIEEIMNVMQTLNLVQT